MLVAVKTYSKPAFTTMTSPVEMSMSPIPPTPASAETTQTPERSDSVIEETWARAMIMIQSKDIEESIDALKIICYELVQATTGSAATVQLLKASANELVKELTHRMQRVGPSLLFDAESNKWFTVCP